MTCAHCGKSREDHYKSLNHFFWAKGKPNRCGLFCEVWCEEDPGHDGPCRLKVKDLE